MKRTIDISLKYDNLKVNLEQEQGLKRLVKITLLKKGFETSLDGSGRSITVSFGNLPTDIHWNDIKDKPDMAEPLYWEEM